MHICIGVAKIEEVKNGQKVFRLKSFQVDQWVRIFAHLEHSFVDISTCQGHIRNLFAFSESPKNNVNIFLEVRLLQAHTHLHNHQLKQYFEKMINCF